MSGRGMVSTPFPHLAPWISLCANEIPLYETRSHDVGEQENFRHFWVCREGFGRFSRSRAPESAARGFWLASVVVCSGFSVWLGRFPWGAGLTASGGPFQHRPVRGPSRLVRSVRPGARLRARWPVRSSATVARGLQRASGERWPIRSSTPCWSGGTPGRLVRSCCGGWR